jgi:hypothetical protein
MIGEFDEVGITMFIELTKNYSIGARASQYADCARCDMVADGTYVAAPPLTLFDGEKEIPHET